MNNTKSLLIGMNLKDAIELDTVKLDKSETYPKEKVLPKDGIYIYFYQPSQGVFYQQQGDQKRRATDFLRSKNTYQLDRVFQRILKYVLSG